MNPLEIAANFFNIVSVYLANRNNIHTWWTGIVGCLLFGVLFFEAKLYADVNLQIFFVISSIWGWWDWLHGGEHKEELPITLVRFRQLFLFFIAAALATMIYGFLLFRLTDASYPFVDSIVLMFSILAQFLLIRRKLENWYLWILVDAVATPLYAARGLYVTAAIYFVFLVNAVWALSHWRKLYRAQQL